MGIHICLNGDTAENLYPKGRDFLDLPWVVGQDVDLADTEVAKDFSRCEIFSGIGWKT